MQGPVEAADRQPTPTMDCSCEENGRQSSGWVRESPGSDLYGSSILYLVAYVARL